MSINNLGVPDVHPELQKLMLLRDKMTADGADHLRGTPLNVYGEPGTQPETDRVGFFKASSYADAKARVRDKIACLVGGDKADEIMKSVLGENQRWDGAGRFWRPNRTAMTRSMLQEAIDRTVDEMIRQGASSPQERKELLAILNQESPSDPAAFMKDHRVRRLVHLAIADSPEESREESLCANFIDSAHDYERRCLNVLNRHRPASDIPSRFVHPEVRSEMEKVANEIRAWVLKPENTAMLGLGRDEKVNLEKANLQLLADSELAVLFHKVLPAPANKLREAASDVIDRKLGVRSTEVLARRQEVEDSEALQVLESFHSGMGADDHLREYDGVVYYKSNHPGAASPAWFHRNHGKSLLPGPRSLKFGMAKQVVRALVAASLRDAKVERGLAVRLAARILRPFADNGRGLSQSDLKQIIGDTEKYAALQEKVSTQMAERQRDDTAQDLTIDSCLNPDKDKDLFASYLELHGEDEALKKYDAVLDLKDCARLLHEKQFAQDRKRDPNWSGEVLGLHWMVKDALETVYKHFEQETLHGAFDQLLQPGKSYSVDDYKAIDTLCDKLLSKQKSAIETTCFKRFHEHCLVAEDSQSELSKLSS